MSRIPTDKQRIAQLKRQLEDARVGREQALAFLDANVEGGLWLLQQYKELELAFSACEDTATEAGMAQDTLRAELERVRGERDQYIERCEDLQTVQLRMVEELARVEGEARVAREERDAARAAAARYKRRAYLLYATWCGYWGVPVDWDFLRTALYDPGVRDE